MTSKPSSTYQMLARYPSSQCSPSNSLQVSTKLCRFRYNEVQDLLEKPSTVLVFLGVEKNGKASSSTTVDESVPKPAAWFAVGTDEDAAELLKRCREKNCSFPKIPNRDLLQFKEDEAGVNPNVLLVLLHLKKKKLFISIIYSVLQESWPRPGQCWPGTAVTASAQRAAAAPNLRKPDTRGAA